MRLNREKATMATQEEMQAFVDRSTPLLDDAERKIDKAYKAVMACADIPDEGRALGMAGFLQSMRLKNETRAIAGMLAGAGARFFEAHEEYTAVSKANGTEPMQPLDGGGHR